MTPHNASSRRPSRLRPGAESLETRSLLTGGAGDTFALIPATITNPGGSVTIPITIEPTHFTLPRGKMTIGIDVAPQPNSSVLPLISRVDNPHNQIVPQAFHSIYNPHLSHFQVARGAGTRAVLSPLVQFPGQPARPATYNVTIQAEGNTSGSVLVAFYLPGDANGDGVVDQADVQLIKSELGSVSGDQNYNFDADANRDGRIGRIDLAYAIQNQGVKTTISPSVTANLDPNSDSGVLDRVTNIQNVHVSGQGTPGAQITFAEVANKSAPVTTTADTNGNYNVILTLGQGDNVFHVASVDAFGQTISGKIAPITFSQFAPAGPKYQVQAPPKPPSTM